MIKSSKKWNPKVLLCTFGFVMVLLVSFAFVKMTEPKEITKTYKCVTFPVFKSDASFFTINDSVAVIDYKNYSLCEFADIRNIVKDTTIIERKIINRYFLFKKRSYMATTINLWTIKFVKE